MATNAGNLPRVICLAGPTGSGKTVLALRIAAELGCEIINTDSRQVYSDFPIITAQPGEPELAACKHHLYGFLPTIDKISAGQWARLAVAKCRESLARGKTPLLVGGTGFYFRSILQGLAEIPEVGKEISLHFERRMAGESSQKLHEELAQSDPDYAARIHPSDRQRIQRALEVLAATGKTFSWWHQNLKPEPLAKGPLLVQHASLAWLEPRLARRISQMLEAGAIEEARAALEKQPDGSGWSGIGCRELKQYLAGEIDLAECQKLWLASTRAYAKRQLTWFRGQKEAIWIEPDNLDQALVAIAAYANSPA